jgi:hypothetical protein
MDRELYNTKVPLLPGREWHSEPIKLRAGDELTVSATAPGRFYAGVFDRRRYHADYGRDAGAFGFEFGTDHRAFTTRFVSEVTDTFYIVLRVGVFSDRTTITLRATVFRDPRGVLTRE